MTSVVLGCFAPLERLLLCWKVRLMEKNVCHVIVKESRDVDFLLVKLGDTAYELISFYVLNLAIQMCAK